MVKVSNLADIFFQSRVATHVAFWLFTLFFLPFYSSLSNGDFGLNFVEMLVMLPLQIVTAYLLIYGQLPRLLYQKHWVLFLLSFGLTAYIFSALSRLVNIYIVEPLTGYEGHDESVWEVFSNPMPLLGKYILLVLSLIHI